MIARLMRAALTTINPVFSPNVGFDPLRDFAYTSLVSIVPMALSVHPSVPARSVKEFIALAKARPGRLAIRSAGIGSNTRFTGELFQRVGVRITMTRNVFTPIPTFPHQGGRSSF